MTNLTWTEQTIVGELAGALMSVASYINHRPESNERLIAAVISAFGRSEKALLVDLDTAVAEVHER